MDRTAYLVGAVAVFIVVAATLIGLAAAIGAVSGLFAPMDDTEPPQYDIDELYREPIAAEGTVDVSPGAAGEPGVVVIDTARASDLGRTDIQVLTSALVAYGHDVRRAGSHTPLADALDEADALIVVDPGTPYGTDRVEAVEEFVDDEGRVLLLGEPSRAALQNEFLTPVDSGINRVAAPLGVSFGSDYVYDMDANDGNHRNVIVTPTDADMMDGVDQAVLSIGTHVTAADGEPLLETAPEARRSAGETAGQYTVATRTGSVVAVGDTTFLAPDRFNVADNEALIAAIVEFLGGEHD